MQHKLYRLGVEKLAKEINKGMKFRAPKGAHGFLPALHFLYANKPEIYGTMEPVIHMEEWAWLAGDKECYFFETPELADNLIRSGSNISDTCNIFAENSVFMLALPSVGFEFCNSGLLVTMVNSAARQQMAKEFFGALGLPEPEVKSARELGDITFAITYNSGSAWSRVILPQSRVVELLNTDEQTYCDFMKNEDKFVECFTDVMTLSDAERKEQYKISKLVCSFLVYKQAMPDRIREGMPGKHTYATPVTGKNKSFEIRAPQHRDTLSAHYRSWHFRQLVNEKYYQGEHAKKPIGSRIVFVSDTTVNREQTNHTAEA